MPCIHCRPMVSLWKFSFMLENEGLSLWKNNNMQHVHSVLYSLRCRNWAEELASGDMLAVSPLIFVTFLKVFKHFEPISATNFEFPGKL